MVQRRVILDNFGLLTVEPDAFRGAVETGDGRFYCMRRDNTDFHIIGTNGLVTSNSLSLATTVNISGGALGENGIVYSGPRDDETVLVIDPNTDTATLTDFGLTWPTVDDKFTGATLGQNGKIYCTPSCHDKILIIDTNTNPATAEFNALGGSWNAGGSGVNRILWVDGHILQDGRIFCCPLNATGVLIIDPAAGTATQEDFGLTFGGVGAQEWGGIELGADELLYCTPFHNQDGVLVIDPDSMTAEVKSYGLTWPAPVNINVTNFSRPQIHGDYIVCGPGMVENILLINVWNQKAEFWVPGDEFELWASHYDAQASPNGKTFGAINHSNGRTYFIPRFSYEYLIFDDGTEETPATYGSQAGMQALGRGFVAAVRPSGTVAITATDDSVSAAGASTYTFSAQSLGAEAADRKVIVGFGFRATTDQTPRINSVTIGGVAATEVTKCVNRVSTRGVIAIYIADVPTGLTGDVVITLSRAATRCGLQVWSMTGCDMSAPTDVAADSSITGTGANPLSMSIDVLKKGGVVACCYGSGLGVPATFTWSGVTEDSDTNVDAATNHTFSAAHDDFATAQTVAITATPATISATDIGMAVAASFRPGKA
jgi:hypothetical protein